MEPRRPPAEMAVVPPKTAAFSKTAVLRPSMDAVTAALSAAAPDPNTSRSYRLPSIGVAAAGLDAFWAMKLPARHGCGEVDGPQSDSD